MATQSVNDYFRTHNNDVVDLLSKLTRPVSNELYDSVCYRADADDDIQLNSRTLLDYLQLANAIYDGAVSVRVDATPVPSIPMALSSKITQLETMVRRINESSRYKTSLKLILDRIVNEHEISNIEVLVKQFLDLYKLYQKDESGLNQLFNELTTLDRMQPVSDTTPVKVYASQKQPSAVNMGSIVATPVINNMPPPPAPQPTPVYQTVAPPQSPSIPTPEISISTPNVSTPEILNSTPNVTNIPPSPPLAPAVDIALAPAVDIALIPPPPPLPPSGSFPPPPPPPPPPMPMPEIGETPSAPTGVTAKPPPKAAPPLDLQTELSMHFAKQKKNLMKKPKLMPLPEHPTSTLQSKRTQAKEKLQPRAQSLLDILSDVMVSRRSAVAESSSASEQNQNEFDDDWLASPELIKSLRVQYSDLQKKMKALPMEPSDAIASLSNAISIILTKKQITHDDSDSLKNYIHQLGESINDTTAL
jgi:hypothetical protein